MHASGGGRSCDCVLCVLPAPRGPWLCCSLEPGGRKLAAAPARAARAVAEGCCCWRHCWLLGPGAGGEPSAQRRERKDGAHDAEAGASGDMHETEIVRRAHVLYTCTPTSASASFFCLFSPPRSPSFAAVSRRESSRATSARAC